MIKAWWQERAPRERWTLIAGGVALALTALYLVIEPVIEERRRLAAEIPQLRQDLAWMKGQVGTIKRLRQQQGPAREAAAGPLNPAQVQAAVRKVGLRDQLAELQTAGEGRVRLSFERAPFPEVTNLLQSLRRSAGARVIEANFQAIAEQPGMVKAQLTLQAEAAS